LLGGGTTRSWLWRLLIVLLAAAALALVTSSWVFQGTRATAERVRAHSVPSVMHVMAARAALVQADAAAIQSFQTGEVGLTGPGENYQNQIAVASQSLTQLAADSITGAGASQTIQLVEGMLASYVGLIEQADAHYRQDAGSVLAIADLWSASRLLHMPEGGILAQLDALHDLESRALAAQVTAGRMAPGWILAWVVAFSLLLALLLVAQALLSGRFRRTFNLPLIGATAAALALVGGMSVDFDARSELAETQDASSSVVRFWRAQTDLVDRHGQGLLKQLVTKHCPEGGCGETVDRFAAALGPVNGLYSPPDEIELTASIKIVNRHAEAAADTGSAQLLVLLAALLALVLVPVGLFPRIDEYRR
jgi:hypothetical protein